MEQGIIVKSTGSWYSVRLTSGDYIDCRIKGKFRLENIKLTNPVAVGDSVGIEIDKKDNTGIIKSIGERKNYVTRQSPRKKHFQHLIACNLDQALLIVTILEPDLKQGFIDRFLLMTEPHDIPTYIVFNKADIYDEETMEFYYGLKYIYEKIGYHVLLVSAEKQEGIEPIKELLKNKKTLISGQSGVGKSSLVNVIEPTVDLRTQELSDYTGKGQHTTTFAEMYELDFGGSLIDTPGIKTLSFSNMEPADVAHNFREFFEYSTDCKYSNCMHLNEPDCNVKTAIENGEISILRYNNYLQILDEIEEQNYWERHKF